MEQANSPTSSAELDTMIDIEAHTTRRSAVVADVDNPPGAGDAIPVTQRMPRQTGTFPIVPTVPAAAPGMPSLVLDEPNPMPGLVLDESVIRSCTGCHLNW